MNSALYSQPLSLLVWNAVTTGGSNVQSPTFRSWSAPVVSAFGNVSAATTITLMYSQDGANWYAGPTVVKAGAGNFFIDERVGAEFLALQSTANVTVTAIISAK